MKQGQKMSFRELHEQMEKPTPIWKYEYLHDWVQSLTIATTVCATLLGIITIAFIVHVM